MMPGMNMVESVNNALDTMLSKDNDVIMFGEDIGSVSYTHLTLPTIYSV